MGCEIVGCFLCEDFFGWRREDDCWLCCVCGVRVIGEFIECECLWFGFYDYVGIVVVWGVVDCVMVIGGLVFEVVYVEVEKV